MFDNNQYGSEVYKNPLSIQHAVLSELHSRLGGNKIVADPNNSFCFLLEATSSMTANSILQTELDQSSIYAKRAVSSEDLYKHMSDFDYVGMTGTPADISLTILLNKSYIIKNAKSYNINYNKVVIPAHTVFMIGKYSFGIYYPIVIQINRNTDSISVIYDTTEDNPLHSLDYNTVPYQEFTFKQLEILSLTIPIYQISRTTTTDDLVSEFGYTKTVSYTDNLYAIRAYNYKNSVFTELGYTLSEEIYDVNTPTIKMSVYPELKEIKFHIPQIYFTKGLMGNKLELTILTTKGELDVDISEITSDHISANFGFDNRKITEFTTLLNSIPTIQFQPNSAKITGGTNGYTYDELREYIINDSLYEKVPVTPIEVESFFAKKGLSIKKQIDNITDRVYHAYRTLTDTEATILPVVNSAIKLTPTSADDTSSIIRSIDDSITILPSTIFRLIDNSTTYQPLTDDEVIVLNGKTPENIAADINTNKYTRTPFHIRMSTNDQYTIAESFNLMDPSCPNLQFIRDNATVSAQMTVTTTAMTYNEDDTGYTLRLGVLKQGDLVGVAEDDIIVYLTTNTVTGEQVGIRANYIGKIGALSVYSVLLTTDHHINKNNNLSITSLETNDDVIRSQYFNMTNSFDVIMAVKRTSMTNATVDNFVTRGLPDKHTGYVGIVRQRFDCVFGTILSTTILNNVNVNWSAQQYELYAEDVYETYPEDVYEHNADGTLLVAIVEGAVVLNKLHSEGDIVQDGEGVDIIRYTQGTVKLIAGEPVISIDRDVEYYIDCMLFHLSLFYTDDRIYADYRKKLPILIESYLNTVLESGNAMLENTDIYFRPTNTLGFGKFDVGDGITRSLPLDLSFTMTIHVYSHVYNSQDSLDMINANIELIIEAELLKETISMTEISTEIKSKLSDYISSIDVGGINGNIALQTITKADVDIQPTISRTLEYSDTKYTLVKQINIIPKKIG